MQYMDSVPHSFVVAMVVKCDEFVSLFLCFYELTLDL